MYRMFRVIQTAVKASIAAAWLRLPALRGRNPRIMPISASVAAAEAAAGFAAGSFAAWRTLRPIEALFGLRGAKRR